MPDFENDPVHDAIKEFLGGAGTSGAWTNTPIEWPNGSEGTFPPNPPAPWVAMRMTGNIFDQESIGAGDPADNLWDEHGTLWLHVFVRVNTGESGARARAKALAKLFRGRQLLDGHLQFGSMSIGMGEPGDDNGNYWRVSASIEWRYQEP
jgi:hypothetical protein